MKLEKKLGHANSFKDLEVYKHTRELSKIIFEMTKTFPIEEKYSLTDQIRRSSRSIGAQIAESWAKRLYRKHFVSKLTDADAELNETEHWVETAFYCGYIEEEEKDQIIRSCQEIGKMIGSMIIHAGKFCPTSTE